MSCKAATQNHSNSSLQLINNCTFNLMHTHKPFLHGNVFHLQLHNLTDTELQKNSSYNITTLTVMSTTVNGTNVTTVVFVVEILTSVNLTENTTLTTAVGDPLSGAIYTIEQLISIIPSGINLCNYQHIVC